MEVRSALVADASAKSGSPPKRYGRRAALPVSRMEGMEEPGFDANQVLPYIKGAAFLLNQVARMSRGLCFPF